MCSPGTMTHTLLSPLLLPLLPPPPPLHHDTRKHNRVVVLRCLREVCSDGQLLVDLFVNYDCDLGSSNLFERMVNGLVKMAQVTTSPAAPTVFVALNMLR